MGKEEIKKCIEIVLKRFRTGDLDYEDSLTLIMSYIEEEPIYCYSPILPTYTTTTDSVFSQQNKAVSDESETCN